MTERDTTISQRPRNATRLPTIRDVARLAGVAKTTASDALSGRPYVAPKTRERVLAAAEQLSYRAHLGARDLTRQRTEVIGVVVGDYFDPASAEFTGHLELCASERGLRVLLTSAGSDLRGESTAITSLMDYRVAALILVAFTGDQSALDGVHEHTPIIFLGYEGSTGVSMVIDDKRGGELATAHLLELGHQRIAYLSESLLPRKTDRDRLNGYRRALRRAGITPERRLVRQLPPGTELERRAWMRDLLSQDDRPTAVFAASDITAIELMSAASDLGLAVPADLSIVGFDDIMLARVPMISLTTVRQPISDLARRGIDVAVRMIHNPTTSPDVTRIEPELIVRSTTRPLH